MCRPDDFPPYENDGPSGHECYAIVANELDVPSDQRREALASLDQAIVERAKQYAKRAHKRWPPGPRGDGWNMTITSYS